NEKLYGCEKEDYSRRDGQAKVEVYLSRRKRQVLEEAATVYRVRIDEVMLVGLAAAIAECEIGQTVLIDVDRQKWKMPESLDVSRTVGGFTAPSKLCVDFSEKKNLDQLIKEVKEQSRRALDGKLIPRPASYSPQGQKNGTGIRSELRADAFFFSFVEKEEDLVKTGGLYETIKRNRMRATQVPFYGCSVIGGGGDDGRLKIEILFNEELYTREIIGTLAACCIKQLGNITKYCRQPGAGGYTPVDFPLAALSQEQLDRLVGHRRDIEDIYPLSPMQEGMLFHTVYAPESRVYFTQISFAIRHDLDQEALERAWQRVIQRYGILRTGVNWEGVERPVQIVYKSVKTPFERQDWRGVKERNQKQELEKYLEADRRRGFELRQAPLLRISLIRLADDVYQLTLSNHHLLLDGWSRGLLIQEVFAYYEIF